MRKKPMTIEVTTVGIIATNTNGLTPSLETQEIVNGPDFRQLGAEAIEKVYRLEKDERLVLPGIITSEPEKPKNKKEGGKLEPWFKWYQAMLDSGYKVTLKDVAEESHFSNGYVRQCDPNYKRRFT
jgi:hypothetical protein